MPLYEDETLQGAIKKAVWGKGPGGKTPRSSNKYPSKSPKSSWGRYSSGKTRGKSPKLPGSVPKSRRVGRIRTETFDNRPFGSTISGGRGIFSSEQLALSGAAREMDQLARANYPDRVEAILGGSTTRRAMLPELATTIEYQEPQGENPSTLRWRFTDITVGERDVDGSGRFAVSGSSRTTAVLHAHWVDNTPSSDDRSIKSQWTGRMRGRMDPLGNRINLGFYIYSFRHGITSY